MMWCVVHTLTLKIVKVIFFIGVVGMVAIIY